MKKRSFLKKLTITGMFMLGLIAVAQADPINLALIGTATQSSTYPPSQYSNHNAGIAIDGITDGNAYQGHITHTLLESNPWWQVDLQDMYVLDEIVLWNRTDSIDQLGVRLSMFTVSVLDESSTVVWSENYFTDGLGYPDPSLVIDLPYNTLGRIVRVSLNKTDYLSLAEVQVFGVPEPGTMLLLGSGLLGLIGLRRKLKK